MALLQMSYPIHAVVTLIRNHMLAGPPSHALQAEANGRRVAVQQSELQHEKRSSVIGIESGGT